MKKVVICQHRLLHYRKIFFIKLRDECAKRGIDLHLVHGQATRRELKKKDEGYLEWADRVTNKVFEFGSRDIIWQPFPSRLNDADLVILMQESRILSNYRFLFSSQAKRPLLAYWGHGANFQSTAPRGLRENWKRWLINRVDWWFAYTTMSVDVLNDAGYPLGRVTCLNNAIDNIGFVSDLNSISDEMIASCRALIGASVGDPVGIFCGSLYPDKKLDFLIDALDLIHAAVPGFRFVVIGDGPSANFVRAATQGRPWLYCVGVKKGVEKAAWFKLADIVLNPGLVGLHVLDSFCSGTPMITTKAARHSPEISYLEHGVNGLIVDGDVSQYAKQVVSLLTSPDTLGVLKNNALLASAKYTLDNMVFNFLSGIESCFVHGRR
jgi:glycosyltransferase involved in cell wall biosynthesis